MENSTLMWIFGGGGATIIALLASLVKVLKDTATLRAGVRTENAKASKEEVGIETAEINNSKLLDDRWKSFIEEMKSHYIKVIDFKDEQIQAQDKRLKEVETKLDKVENHQLDQSKKIEELEAKVSKRDWWLRSANKCPLVQNPMECIVIKTMVDADDRKSEKLKLREQCCSQDETNQ